MSKILLKGAALVALVGGGYYVYSGQHFPGMPGSKPARVERVELTPAERQAQESVLRVQDEVEELAVVLNALVNHLEDSRIEAMIWKYRGTYMADRVSRVRSVGRMCGKSLADIKSPQDLSEATRQGLSAYLDANRKCLALRMKSLAADEEAYRRVGEGAVGIPERPAKAFVAEISAEHRAQRLLNEARKSVGLKISFDPKIVGAPHVTPDDSVDASE